MLPFVVVDHGAGRPRILVADPSGGEGFRHLHMPMANVDLDALNDESSKGGVSKRSVEKLSQFDVRLWLCAQ